MTEEQSNSLQEKFKRIMYLSCCFATRRHPPDSPNDDKPKPSLVKASSNWIKTRTHDIPEMKDMCTGFVARIGKHHCRRHSAADFRYDPLSYSLNFEDGVEASRIDEAPLKDFCSRLPPSPPLKPALENQTPLERA